MSYMFEVYYKAPACPTREAALTEKIIQLGGRLDFREDPAEDAPMAICLTFEFDDRNQAEFAADSIRRSGDHVEGPVEYGPVESVPEAVP